MARNRPAIGGRGERPADDSERCQHTGRGRLVKGHRMPPSRCKRLAILGGRCLEHQVRKG